jgi:hypothetical protein
MDIKRELLLAQRRRALDLVLREERKRRKLIVVRRCVVEQVGVAAVAQGNEVIPRSAHSATTSIRTREFDVRLDTASYHIQFWRVLH